MKRSKNTFFTVNRLAVAMSALMVSNAWADDACRVIFSPTDNVISIPCLEVENMNGLYSVKLQKPSADSLQFAITNLLQNQTDEATACKATYSLETGDLTLPCVDVINPPISMESYALTLHANNPSSPSYLTLDMPVTEEQSNQSNRRALADYPYRSVCPSPAGGRYSSSDVDQWNFYKCECTSYAASMLSKNNVGVNGIPFTNRMQSAVIGDNLSDRWSDAHFWKDKARSLNIPVDNSPRVGDIAWWGVTSSTPVGHVAYVESVNSDGSVNISEYNGDGKHNIGTRNYVRAAAYIHFGTVNLSTPTLSTPNASASIPSGNVNFSWTAVPNATTYRLVVSESNSFSDFNDAGNATSSCKDSITCQTIATSATTASFSLRPDRVYYWKVRAGTNISGGSSSQWSTVRSLATQPITTGNSTTFRTPSPYSDNMNMSQQLCVSGANSLTVTSSGKTEAGYDFLTIFDNNGSQLKKLNGTINDSFIASGSCIRVNFTSDSSVTYQGVVVTVSKNETTTTGGSGTADKTTFVVPANYATNLNLNDRLCISGASQIMVRATGQIENNWDKLYLTNLNTNSTLMQTGNIDYTARLDGSCVGVRFSSDTSVSGQGVVVSISR